MKSDYFIRYYDNLWRASCWIGNTKQNVMRVFFYGQTKSEAILKLKKHILSRLRKNYV